MMPSAILRKTHGVAGLLGLALASAPALAQASFLIGLGGAFPAGGIASRIDPTFAGLLGVEIQGKEMPVGLRIDDTYAQFTGPNGWAAIDGITFGGVFGEKHPGKLEPYAIAGLGPYYVTGSALGASFAGYRSSWVFGMNAGGGIKYGGRFAVFLEARYHLMFQGGQVLQYIPVMVGISLR